MFAFSLMPLDQFCGLMFICLVICLGSALPILGVILKKAAMKGK
jgi:hypothetical protein